MFVVFMPLHILLCDEVLLYFILQIVVRQNSNLFLSLKFGLLYKGIKKKKMFFFSLLVPWAESSVFPPSRPNQFSSPLLCAAHPLIMCSPASPKAGPPASTDLEAEFMRAQVSPWRMFIPLWINPNRISFQSS
jgi:hypothetical protein